MSRLIMGLSFFQVQLCATEQTVALYLQMCDQEWSLILPVYLFTG
jgi:hypothetical protein